MATLPHARYWIRSHNYVKMSAKASALPFVRAPLRTRHTTQKTETSIKLRSHQLRALNHTGRDSIRDDPDYCYYDRQLQSERLATTAIRSTTNLSTEQSKTAASVACC